MPPVRVLIVDDSTTMRALFTGVLEKAPGITVVDHAASAAEARELIAKLRPDVITLDVEMPGTSGLELLREIMAERPMPVVMLSTLTQKGASATLEALELGAFDCFPKPRAATIEEFGKIGPKLAKLIRSAASGQPVRATAAAKGSDTPFVAANYAAGDSVVALIGNTGAVDAISALVNRFPAACPPTIVHLGGSQTVVDALVERLDKTAAPVVRAVFDGQRLESGNVYFVQDPERHAVVDRWPGAAMRVIDGPAINGHRSSASLLLQSLAKTAGGAVKAAFVSGIGDDGIAAIAAVTGAGGQVFAVPADAARASELPTLAAMAAGTRVLPIDELGIALLGMDVQQAAAA